MPTRARWFQFGIAAMLIALPALVGFAIYHVNWIRKRHAFLDSSKSWVSQYSADELDPSLTPRDVPPFLRLFGEKGQGAIYVDFGKPATWEEGLNDEQSAELNRIAALFPEAGIVVGGHLFGESFIGVKRLR